MNWFRKHLKLGSRLALFALAIQFALSFGHFHGTAAVQAAPAAQSGLADADLAIAATLAERGTHSEAAQRQQPAGHDDDHHTAKICACCAVLSLANNFLFATPPRLELPRAVELLYLTTDAEFAHLGSLHPAFHSRAPPVS
ncbi:DUF2946 family protein [Bradyrhizobium sp. sBnM-33]|uniref:DUF2946 family protein n=1 Tax=Bradyrhizobium sp. sBnM-33 TaxID=2831780 RepID=UPI001BCBAA2E|nr:DUF2946 family protein [Bradyrhizobium sp. sBnM-33]WOH48288.1 hypothetical protein RX328_29740 [Bradyrhizobium sp. sBnM-33]